MSEINSLIGLLVTESAGIFDRETVEAGLNSRDFRSLAASSDGKYLAAGDCDGNIHIFNLLTSDYTCLQASHWNCD